MNGIRNYSANISISSSLPYTPSVWTKTHYKAGNYIQLTDGFKASGPAYFEAQIGDCLDIASDPLSAPMIPSGRFIMTDESMANAPNDN